MTSQIAGIHVPEPDLKHPHDLVNYAPKFMSKEDLAELSRTSQFKLWYGIFFQWAVIAGAIWLCETHWSPALYLLCFMIIGGRQHAFPIIGHDGSHFRNHKNRFLNDLLTDMFCYLPCFESTQAFRQFHGPHHRFLGTERDANRLLWGTHRNGKLTPEWIYPKTVGGFIKKLAKRSYGGTGIRWIHAQLKYNLSFRGKNKGYTAFKWAYYLIALGTIVYFKAETQFVIYWLAPLTTYFVFANYFRLIFEHSNVPNRVPPFDATRTTIPTLLDATLFLPVNVSFHLEHHLYPSIPWYNLRKAHAVLMQNEEFRTHACICHGISESLGQVLCRKITGEQRNEGSMDSAA